MESFHIISKYAICYTLFFLLTWLSKSDKSDKLITRKGFTANPGMLLGLQIAGILWLGIIPLFIFHYSLPAILYGKQFPDTSMILTIVFVLLILIQIAAMEAMKKIANLTIGENSWIHSNKKFISRYIILRILFLAAYEIFFRGYLLADSIHTLGLYGAIVLNVFLYTLLHIFCEKNEILACIPFGTLLCCLCIWTGAVWPAIIIHISFSLCYESMVMQNFFIPVKKIQ
jgi:membrane protease YdiL (CAAX protease family)